MCELFKNTVGLHSVKMTDSRQIFLALFKKNVANDGKYSGNATPANDANLCFYKIIQSWQTLCHLCVGFSLFILVSPTTGMWRQAALLTGTVSLLMLPQRLPIKKKIEDLVSYNIALALIVPSLVESRH